MAGKSPHSQVTRPRWWTDCCTASTWPSGGRGGSPDRSSTRLPPALLSLDLIIFFIQIFSLIEKTGVCTPSQALLVIKCCGNVLVDLDRKSRSKIAEKCFNMLKSLSDTPLDISHYNALLKVGIIIW